MPTVGCDEKSCPYTFPFVWLLCCSLLVKWRFENRIGKQMEAIKKVEHLFQLLTCCDLP